MLKTTISHRNSDLYLYGREKQKTAPIFKPFLCIIIFEHYYQHFVEQHLFSDKFNLQEQNPYRLALYHIRKKNPKEPPICNIRKKNPKEPPICNIRKNSTYFSKNSTYIFRDA